MKIVLFVDDQPYLLLDKVKFVGNQLKSGQVVNGDWELEISQGISRAKIGDEVLNAWQYTAPYYYLAVPPEVIGRYEDIIGWAVNQDRSHRCPV